MFSLMEPTGLNSSFRDAVSRSNAVCERRRALEEKGKAYERLIETLGELPERTRYRALVPLAPGLYAPGQLVHTNEILVLLGSTGGADINENHTADDERVNNQPETFFAERSAKQAQGIAQRRLQHIRCDLEKLSATEYLVEPEEAKTRETASQVGKRAPNVTAVSEVDVSKLETMERGTTKPEEKNKLKRKVSFGEYVEQPASESGSRKQPASILKPQSRSGYKADRSHASDESEHVDEGGPASDEKGERTRLVDELKHAIENARHATVGGGIVHLTEYFDDDEGTVNGSENPRNVEISGMQGVCNDGIDFGEDSTEYLDISGPQTNRPEQSETLYTAANLDDWQKRKAFLDDLADAEDALNLAEHDDSDVKNSDDESNSGGERNTQSARAADPIEKQQKRGNKQQQSRDTFGSGFSRGFFNSGATSSTTRDAKVKVREQKSYDIEEKKGVGQQTILSVPVSGPTTCEESFIPELSRNDGKDPLLRVSSELENLSSTSSISSGKSGGDGAVSDRTVGEHVTGRRRRRQQRVAVVRQAEQLTSMYECGRAGTDCATDENEGSGSEGVSRPISRFMQMRMAQRSSK